MPTAVAIGRRAAVAKGPDLARLALPPDQYEALLLQISEGCPWDRCHFCTLYRDQPFRDRTIEEIRRHVDEVLVFLGASAARIRRVFLGQANALLRPTDELLEVFALIGAAHVERVAGRLQRPTAPPLARQRRSSVIVRHLHPESLTAVLHDPPLAHAVHEHLRRGEPPEPPAFEAAVSRRVELVRDGLQSLLESLDETQLEVAGAVAPGPDTDRRAGERAGAGEHRAWCRPGGRCGGADGSRIFIQRRGAVVPGKSKHRYYHY